MINIEILEGLKRATESGNTLKRAMMSFYNSGYEKLEIETAAKEFLAQKSGRSSLIIPQQPIAQPIQQQVQQVQPTTQQVQQPQVVQQPIQQIAQPIQQIAQPIQQPAQLIQPMNKQNVSQYEKKSKVSGITVFLISALIVLLILLTLMFVFRSQLISFFNNIF